jgi:hypothetical protein
VVLDIIQPDRTGQIRHEVPNPGSGGYMATSSGWGPTMEMDLKPQLATPGADFLGITVNGSYAVVSGTSFATPLLAAIYALVAQVRGTKNPAELERLLATTANPNLFYDGRSVVNVLAPTPQQGAGLVQAYDAAHTTTIVDVSSLQFNDTAHMAKNLSFTISNKGQAEVTYKLGHSKAATVYAFTEGRRSLFPPPIAEGSASIAFSSESVAIPAGGSALITVTPTPPTGLEEIRIPIYSGYITINGTNSESLSIPYVGAAASLSVVPVIVQDDLRFRNWTNVDYPYDPVPPDSTFIIPRPTAPVNERTPNDVPYPSFHFSWAWNTALMRVDIVPLEVNGPLETEKVLGVDIAGSMNRFPMQYPADGFFSEPFNGMLGNGKIVPEGRYEFLLRGLKVLGDRTKPEDYESITLGPFNLKYAT